MSNTSILSKQGFDLRQQKKMHEQDNPFMQFDFAITSLLSTTIESAQSQDRQTQQDHG
jgi:hypothetical protein